MPVPDDQTLGAEQADRTLGGRACDAIAGGEVGHGRHKVALFQPTLGDCFTKSGNQVAVG